MLSTAAKSMDVLRRIGGIHRVLTRWVLARSGGRGPSATADTRPSSGLNPTFPPAAEWIAELSALQTQEDGFPAILPGSGINADSLATLLGNRPDGAPSALCRAVQRGDIRELHASCSSWVEGLVEERARKRGMGFGVGGEGEWGRWEVIGEKVRALRRVMDKVGVESEANSMPGDPL